MTVTVDHRWVNKDNGVSCETYTVASLEEARVWARDMRKESLEICQSIKIYEDGVLKYMFGSLPDGATRNPLLDMK